MYKRHEFIITFILSYITGGIYSFYVYYKMANDLNDMARKEGSAEISGFIKAFLLGMITCGIYFLYWLYKLCVLKYDIAAKRGVSLTPDTAILAFVCTFIPILSWYILCENFNKTADSFSA